MPNDEKAPRKWTAWPRLIWRRLFVLPLRWALPVLAVGFGLLIVVFACNVRFEPLRYAAYALSAYALTVACACLPGWWRALRSAVHVPIPKKLREAPYVQRYLTEPAFRLRVSLWQGLFFDLLYAGLKLFSGVRYRTVWFLALAVYYAVLALTHFLLLRGGRRDGRAQLRSYISCGVLLLMLHQALVGIVALMVRREQGFVYPGLLIYVMAAYAFYSVILAAVDLLRFRKNAPPAHAAAKAVRLATALVSILALETAMLSSFGGSDGPEFRAVMTACTGGGVCLLVILMAIFMIVKGARQLHAARREERQEETY